MTTLTNVQLTRVENVTADGTGAVSRTVGDKNNEIVSVKDYGAKGDGTTDDTAAIQAAINVDGNIGFPPGKYKVTDTITIPSGHNGQTLYSLAGSTSYPTNNANVNAEIYFDKADSGSDYTDAVACFLVNAPGVSFQGLWIHGNVNTRNQIGVKTTVTTADLADDADTKFDNCQFNDWKYAIYHIGRGAEVTGCLINTCTTGVLLDWPGSGVGPDDGSVPISTDNDYANRGTRIQDNRFHGLTAAVWHIGSFPLVGALITGNHLDIGTGLFRVGTNVDGSGGQETRDTLISNNVVTFGFGNPIQYWRESKSTRDHITGNHFSGGINTDAGDRTPLNSIYFRSCHTIKDLTISNNYIAYNDRYGILIDDEDGESPSASNYDGINIHNNTFVAWGLDGNDDRAAIHPNYNMNNLSIKNNTFNNVNITDECIRFNGKTQTNLHISGNTITGGDADSGKLYGSGGDGGTDVTEVPPTLTIVSGYVVIKNSYHIIAAETGTSDLLGSIYGGYLGQILVLQPDTGDTITVVGDSSGNIRLALTNNFEMNNTADKLTLIFTGTEWQELSKSNNNS